MKLLSLSAVVLSFLAVGCTSALSGGGLPGRLVNDALPDDATIYTWDHDKHGKKNNIVPGTESHFRSDIIWVTWDVPVPCSDIKGVDWWTGGDNDGLIGLPLVGGRYGNQYIPAPPSGKHWLRPEILVDRDGVSEKLGDFSKEEAFALAEHCGVEVQIRR